MARRVQNFIEAFLEYSSIYNAPERYRRWAAVWCLSVAAKRSIATKVRGNMLAPNLFVQLIGGPSTGKSQTINAIKSILSPATKYTYIPPSVTRAGLEDFMVANMQTRKAPDGRLLASNECIGLSEEMQGILPDQDLGHLTMYNLLYDLPNTHKAVTRSHGELKLEAPYCAIFTGAQPAFLATTLPEQAWGMGFMSRSIMVWGLAPERRSMFEHGEPDTKLQEALITDLRDVFNTHGWMTWTKDAMALYNIWWVQEGGIPIPKHTRLQMGYNGRRELHMVKLAMCMSLAENTELVVEERHVAEAIQLLLEAESQMRFIFNEINSTGSMTALEDIIDYVRQNTAAGRTTPESEIYHMLMQRFHSTQVRSLIDNMLKSNALEVVGNDERIGLRNITLGRKGGALS